MTSPGTLFVVATPIGNLEDITLRALRTLREADVIAAEDTRHTAKLLRHYEIRTRLLSLHEHNEYARIPTVIDWLNAGKSVALVSDAGTPAISDPGAALVRAVRAAGLPVVPIPGPSVITTVMSAAGLSNTPFAFVGFPPARGNDRKQWFARAAALEDIAVVWFEAPHRLRRTLQELAAYLVERPISLARELTKRHEEWQQGTARELLTLNADPRGEYVIVIHPSSSSTDIPARVSDEIVANLFGQLTNINAFSRRAAIRAVAERLKLPAREIYAAIERVKSSGV